jgi:hypothetical protein
MQRAQHRIAELEGLLEISERLDSAQAAVQSGA